MMHWRHEENKKKRQGSRKDDARFDPAGSGTAPIVPALSEQPPPMPLRTKRTDSTQSSLGPSGLSPDQSQDRTLRAGPRPLASDSDLSRALYTGSSSWQLTATDTESYFPQYRNKQRNTGENDVINYEESERHEERQLRSLVVGLANSYNVGGSYDPFDVLPQFRNPRIDALYLARNCKFRYSVLRTTSDAFRYARIRL